MIRQISKAWPFGLRRIRQIGQIGQRIASRIRRIRQQLSPISSAARNKVLRQQVLIRPISRIGPIFRAILRNRKSRRKAMAITLALLLLITSLHLLIPSKEAEAAWWDDNWGFRKKVTISNSGSEQTDFQVGMSLNTSTLITNGKMQADCDDIRVTNQQGNVLPHFTQACNETDSVIWVKLATVPTYNITLYVYYGNASASNAEDGDSVFVFFDDFNDDTIDTLKWKVTLTSGSMAQSYGTLQIYGQGGWNAGGVGSNKTFDRSSQAYMIYWRVQMNNVAADGMFGYSPSTLNINDGILHRYQGSAIWLRRRDGADSAQLGSFAADTWYDIETLMKSGVGYTLYKDGASLEDDTTFADNNHSVAMQHADTYKVTYDSVYVRKYVSTAPSASVGSEEVGPGPSAYWKMDEGFGQAIHDSTANNNDLNFNPLTKIEQQINILSQTYLSDDFTGSYIPTDNSLGIIRWDADKYPDADVYFEAVLRDNGNDSGSTFASLYTTSGSQVAGSEVSYGGNVAPGYSRVRTATPVPLTDDTDYTVRVKDSSGNPNVAIKAARLIVIQSNNYGIGTTETQIEVGHAESQSSSTATQLTDKKIYYYDSSKFSPTPSTYFEATLRNSQPTIEQQINILDQVYERDDFGASYIPTDNSLGIVRWDVNKYSGTTSVYFEAVLRDNGNDAGSTFASLYTTSGSQVSGSEVSYGQNVAAGYARVRSGSITLTDDTDYTVRVKDTSGNPHVGIKAARLIIIQTNSTKITDTETQIEVGDQEKFTNSSYNPLTDSKYYYYDTSKFSGTETHNFEASLEGGIKQGKGRIWSSGYELNATGNEEFSSFSGTYSIQNTTVRSGSYAMQNNTSSSNGYVNGIWANTGTDQDVYMRFYFRYAAAPDVLTKIFNFRIALDERASIRMNSNGTLELWNASSQIGQDSPALAANTWYRIEVHYDSTFSGSNDILEARINGVTFAASDTQDLGTVGRFRFGILDTATANVYFDDIALNNSTGKWPGPGRIIHLKPNAAGDNSAWTNDYTYVDELTPDDDTTLVSSNTLDQIDDHNIDNSSLTATDIVNLVQVGVRFNGYGASANASFVMRLKATSGGTVEESSAITPDSQTWRTNGLENNYGYPLTLYDLPGSSTHPWYDAYLDSAQIGYRLSSASTNAAQISTVWLLIDYTPSSELEGTADDKFADHFESGDFSAWDNTVDPDTDELNVTTASKKFGKYGMAVTIDDQDSIYAQDNSIGSVTKGSARFYFHPNNLSMTLNDEFVLFIGANSSETEVNLIQMLWNGLNYRVRAACRNDSAGYDTTDLYTISDAWHLLEIGWKASSGAGNNDGSCELIIDNVSKEVKGGIDNDTYTWDKAGIGAVSGVDAGTGPGTIYFDAYEMNTARREIGPPAQAQLQYAASEAGTWYDVADAEVISAGQWSRQKTQSALTLTDAQIYRVVVNSDGENHDIANAKIVIDQTAAGGITDVEVVHQQVNTRKTDTDATYTDQDYFNLFNPDLTGDEGGPNFGGGILTYYFESTLKTSNGSNAAYARLYNDSEGSAIAGSEVNTSNTAYTRARSGDITANMPKYPQETAKRLDTQLKNNSTDTTSASSSWLIIQVSSLATSGVTAYADLYNIDDTSQVASSEISTTSPSWTRVRTGRIISLTTAKQYVVRLRSSNNNVPIYMASAKIIHDQTGGVTALEMIHHHINTLNTDSDSTYTDQDYLNEFDPTNFAGGTFTYYFEATMKTTATTTGYAKLKNDSDGNEIDDDGGCGGDGNPTSQISTTATSYERKISAELSSTCDWPSSAKNMDSILKNSTNSTTSVSSSWLIIRGTQITAVGEMPTWKTEEMCVSGKCLYFDGAASAAIALNSDSIDLDQQLVGGFTFQTWARINSDGENNVGEIFDKGTNTYLRITNEGTDGLADLEAKVDLATDATLAVTNGITLNKWHHIVLVYTDDLDDEITIYIDGINKGSSVNGDGAPDSDDNNFLLGGSSTANFHGFLDEFKIYKKERTLDEIKTDFIKGTSSLHGVSAAQGLRDYSSLSEGLVGYWKMDETSGTNVADYSGNGNNGTLTNAQETGTAEADHSTTTVVADDDNSSLATANDAYNGMILRITGGTCGITAGTERTISDYVYDATPTREITVSSAFSAEADGCTFEIRHQSRGKFGKGLGFDEHNDNVNLGSPSSLDNSGQPLTISAWFYVESTNVDDVFIYNADSGANGDGIYLFLWAANQQVAFGIDSTGFGADNPYYRSVSGSYSLNTWTHVAATWDGNIPATAANTSVYINGQEVSYSTQQAGAGTVDDSSTTKYIGASFDSCCVLHGALDEVRYYKRALSPAEVAALYNWAPGPVGYWNFDEGTGVSSVYDRSGNGYNATMNGSMTNDDWVPGKYGSALEFDGSNDYVENTSFQIPSLQGTASAWVYPQEAAGEYDILGGGTSGNDFRLSPRHDVYGFYIGGEYRVSYATDPTANTWTFVTLTWDQTSGSKLFYNGVQVASNSSPPPAFSQAGIQIGQFGGEYLQGIIDDVRIYNYARTTEQIVEDMNAGHPAPGSPIGTPVIHWKFDELYGSTANNSGTDATLDGTATGTVWRLENSTSGGCKLGGCVNIDTATDDITRADPSFFDSLTGMTASFWLNPQIQATTRAIVSKSNTSQETFLIQTDASNSDEIRVYIADTLTDTANYYTTNNLDLTAAATYANWQHITVVYEAAAVAADRVKVYKNGILAGGTVTGTIPSDGLTASSANFQVGESHKATSALLTYIDEVKIYNFALTADQVKVDATAGSAASMGGVLGTHDNEGFGGDPPVGWWNLNENTGTTAYDTSGNGKTGTLTNGPEWIPVTGAPRNVNGLAGSTLKFNGTGQYVTIGTGPTSVRSVAFWVYPETTTEYFINIVNYSDYILANAGTVTAIGFTSPTIYVDGIETSTIVADKWQHVVITTDTAENASNLEIARNVTSGGNLYLEGKMDDIRLYAYALSQTQVAYVYSRGGPVGYWKFDECQATTAYDSSGKGNNGTINAGDNTGDNDSAGTCSSGATAPADEMWDEGTTGKRNASLDFDGTNDYVEIADTDILSFGNSSNDYPFSISAWVNMDEATYFQIFSKGGSSTAREYFLQFSLIDKLELYLYDENSENGIYARSNNAYTSDQGSWLHLAATYDGSSAASGINLYRNGVLIDSTNSSIGSYTAMHNLAQTAVIGRQFNNGSTYADGRIDDVRVYNYALTADQVKRVYNSGAVFFGPATGSP